MSSGQFFYYYTDSVEAVQILNERILRSVGGVTLSTLPPEGHTCDEVLYSTHGNIISTELHGYIVVVKGSTLDFSKLCQFQPNQFTYFGDIDISNERGASSLSSSYIGASYGNTSGSSGSVASQPPIIFCYYTNVGTAARIKTEGHTASYVLLTIMKPEHFSQDQVLETLYGKHFEKGWADFYVNIDARKLVKSKLKQLSRVVCEYSDTIIVKPIDIMQWTIRRRYTLDQKLYALRRKKAGKTAKKISEEMGISQATLHYWLKNEDEIISAVKQLEDGVQFMNSTLSTMQPAATGFSNEVQSPTLTPTPNSMNSMLSSQWTSRNYNDHPPPMQSAATGIPNEAQSPTLTPTPHSMNSIWSSQWHSRNYNDHPPPMQSAAGGISNEAQSPTLTPIPQSMNSMLLRNYNDHPPPMQSAATRFSNEVQTRPSIPIPHSIESILSSTSRKTYDHPPSMQSAATGSSNKVQLLPLNPIPHCSQSTWSPQLQKNYNDPSQPIQTEHDEVDSFPPVSEFSELQTSSSSSNHEEEDSSASSSNSNNDDKTQL